MVDVPDNVEIIGRHLDDFFDQEEITVLHGREASSDPCRIHLVAATRDRPFNILLTCGLSAQPMQVPQDCDDPPLAELMMLLPPQWPLAGEALQCDDNRWPIRVLQELCRFPQREGAWLATGHTWDNGAPFAEGVGFSAVVLLDSMELSRDFTTIPGEEGEISIYSVVPLYPEELDLLKGGDRNELLDRFNARGVEEIVDPGRVNVAVGS